ncbi:hypothetical protein KSP40_PGU019510 [Platanthera guangdongensis]|uniref:Uncharacterized protein n=1 Tax=Platanthera guangdongensis TaxID=2320717 RepID=A0ABR2LVY2_9ASPA
MVGPWNGFVGAAGGAMSDIQSEIGGPTCSGRNGSVGVGGAGVGRRGGNAVAVAPNDDYFCSGGDDQKVVRSSPLSHVSPVLLAHLSSPLESTKNNLQFSSTSVYGPAVLAQLPLPLGFSPAAPFLLTYIITPPLLLLSLIQSPEISNLHSNSLSQLQVAQIQSSIVPPATDTMGHPPSLLPISIERLSCNGDLLTRGWLVAVQGIDKRCMVVGIIVMEVEEGWIRGMLAGSTGNQ